MQGATESQGAEEDLGTQEKKGDLGTEKHRFHQRAWLERKEHN